MRKTIGVVSFAKSDAHSDPLCKWNVGNLWDFHNGNYPVLLKKPYLLKIKVGLTGKEFSVKNCSSIEDEI